MGRRWARLDERLDVGGGGCLSGQASVKGAGRQRLCGLGDGFILGLAGVVVVDEIGHAAKHLGKWRDVVGQRAPPSAMGWVGTGSCYRATRVRSNFRKVACRWTAVGRPGPTFQPMAWVGTRATPKAAGLQRMLWPGRPRMGGLRSATATRTIRDKESLRRHIARRCFTLSGLVRVRSDQRDGRADHDDTIFAV
jgi:hypothetical protein